MTRERGPRRIAAWAYEAGRRAAALACGLLIALLIAAPASASGGSPDDGYSGSDLWLRYERVSDAERLRQYRRSVTTIVVENAGLNPLYRHTEGLRMEPGSSEQLVETTLEAARAELIRGLGGMLDRRLPVRADWVARSPTAQ